MSGSGGSGLVSRRRKMKGSSGWRMLGKSEAQGDAIMKALADEYDAEWEDEDDGEDNEHDSGLGTASGSGTSSVFGSESDERGRAVEVVRRFEVAKRKRHLKMSRRLIQRQSRVVDVLGGSGDPFAAMPDAIRGSDLLVYHWNHVIAHSGVAGPRKDWFPFALQSPTLFQATIFVAASSFDTMNGRRMPTLFLTHRGELIRTISSRLEDPERAATDATIGAVAMIYMVDSMRNSKEVALTHLKGLQQLIYARGGLTLLDPRVQVMIKLVDLLGSTYLRTPPHFHDSRFENVAPAHLFGHASASTEVHATAFAARLASFTGDFATADACATLYWGLRNLTLVLESSRTTWHNGIEFSTRAEFLEREVRRLTRKLDDKKQAHADGAVDDASSSEKANDGSKTAGVTVTGPGTKYNDSLIFYLFCTAAHIYIHSKLQQLDFKLPVYALMAKVLEESLSVGDARLKTLLGTFPDLMLWVLFLGGNAAPWGRKGWFARTATRVLLVKKLEERQGVETAAGAFLWPEGRANYDPTPGGGILEAEIPE